MKNDGWKQKVKILLRNNEASERHSNGQSLTGQSDREVRDEPRSTNLVSKQVLKTAAGGGICKKPMRLHFPSRH